MKNKVVENKTIDSSCLRAWRIEREKSIYAVEILRRENSKNSCLSKECSRIGEKKSFHRIDRIIGTG